MLRDLETPHALARADLMGQPYHGLAVQVGAGNATLDLPNSTTKGLGKRFSNGNTRLTKRPGWAAVSRTGDAAARDTANGWSWPNYWIFGGFFYLASNVGGTVSPDLPAWVFLDSDGSAWLCCVQRSPLKLHYQRFGVFSHTPAALSNITPTAPPTAPSSSFALENHSADGSRACWRDPVNRKLYEITVSGSGGGGPATASFTETNLVLTDSYSESVGTYIPSLCPPPPSSDPGWVWGASDVWGSVDKSLTLEYIASSAYVGDANTLSHDYVKIVASVTGSASNSNTCTYEDLGGEHGNSTTGPWSWQRDEDVTWSYTVSVKKDVGSYSVAKTITASRSSSINWTQDIYSPAEDGSYSATVSDAIVADGLTTWTGDYSYSVSHIGNGDINPPAALFYAGPPSLAASVGIGSYSADIDRSTWPYTLTESSAYPNFHRTIGRLGSAALLLTTHASKFTLPSGLSPEFSIYSPTSYISNGIEIAAFWGGVGCDVARTTNNILTIMTYKQPPTDPSAMTKTWGPCIATEATDAATLVGDNHYASYHPVTKSISRSTTHQRCWL